MHVGGRGGSLSVVFLLWRCVAARCAVSGSVGSLHTFACVCPVVPHTMFFPTPLGYDSLETVGERRGRLVFYGGGFGLFVSFLSSYFPFLGIRRRSSYLGVCVSVCICACGHTFWLFVLAGLWFLCVFLCVSCCFCFFFVVCVALVSLFLSYLSTSMRSRPIHVGYAGGGVRALYATWTRRRCRCLFSRCPLRPPGPPPLNILGCLCYS